jgi:hypothetical protein
MPVVATDSSNNSTITSQNSTDALFQFKQFAKQNGWSASSSGDGLSAYSPVYTLDVLSSSGSGANGFGNSNAWFSISHLQGGHFCFQRGSSDSQFRVKYSPSVGFSSGAASNKVGSASDEKIILGGGTDANPIFDQLFRTSGEQLKCHYVFDLATGYWAMFGNKFGVQGISFLHVFDKLQNTNLSDSHPYVIILDGQNGSPSTSPGSVAALNSGSLNAVSSAPKVSGYIKRGDALEYFGSIQAFEPSIDGTPIIGSSTYSMPSSPYTSKDGTMPLIYAKRPNSTPSSPFPSGIKGQSAFLKWHLQARSTYYTFSSKISRSSTATEDRIVIGNISLPWDGSSVSW